METVTISLDRYEKLREKERDFDQVTKELNEAKKALSETKNDSVFGKALVKILHSIHCNMTVDVDMAITKAGYSIHVTSPVGNTVIGRGENKLYVNAKIKE